MSPGESPISRLREDDFAQVVSAMDERLEGLPLGETEEWAESDEGLLYLQSLSMGLLPLAGLDEAASMAHARTFIENFPVYGMPLGDVDERAAQWLAQLLDTGSIRRDYHQLFAALADAWKDAHPLAAECCLRWSDSPNSSDPRKDLAWMRAMVAIARTQL